MTIVYSDIVTSECSGYGDDCDRGYDCEKC